MWSGQISPITPSREEQPSPSSPVVNAGDISPLTPSGTPPLPPTAAAANSRPQSAYTPPRPLSAYTPPGEKSYTPPPQDCFTPPLPPPPPPPATAVATATFESPTAKLTPPLPPGPPPPRRRFETESGEEGSLSGMELKENIYIYLDSIFAYIFFKGLVTNATLCQCIHSKSHSQNGTLQSSISIRRGLSPPFPHCICARRSVGKSLPRVLSRDLNSGLPYSRPVHYQLSYAAPYFI